MPRGNLILKITLQFICILLYSQEIVIFHSQVRLMLANLICTSCKIILHAFQLKRQLLGYMEILDLSTQLGYVLGYFTMHFKRFVSVTTIAFMCFPVATVTDIGGISLNRYTYINKTPANARIKSLQRLEHLGSAGISLGLTLFNVIHLMLSVDNRSFHGTNLFIRLLKIIKDEEAGLVHKRSGTGSLYLARGWFIIWLSLAEARACSTSPISSSSSKNSLKDKFILLVHQEITRNENNRRRKTSALSTEMDSSTFILTCKDPSTWTFSNSHETNQVSRAASWKEAQHGTTGSPSNHFAIQR
ncbi:hypothetical protein PsorP6_014566 [Peronosclerospora sorghi]|uniref:Uncharacterized protein n=1 Tax=Peronosclerospora sorghi TaxID=230839 RepID=A0ACC0VV45_9STRA|nr:hypothetical protein PsorP6_014566 [Peronosclerospora sorghi]